MAFTSFTLEGEATLGFFASEIDDRHVRIKQDDDPSESPGERIEMIVARSLGFPNDSEFDEMFQRNEALRDQGLQPADGEADVLRTGTRLRITVEVVEDDDS